MEKLKHKIQLILGDPSGDGHKEHSNLYIQSNLSRKQILNAYEKGTKIVGFNFSEEIASEWEDDTIEEEKLKKLRELGFKVELSNEEFCRDRNEEVNLGDEDFAEMYLFIAKLGNPKFEYEFVVSDAITIGGYGLFTS